jgi:formamidopyrimidine-DNA glycosylase
MPELPEVYALSTALNKLGFETEVYGKHLILKNLSKNPSKDKNNIEDWSFGLEGTVYLKYKDLDNKKDKNDKNDKNSLTDFELLKIEHNAFSGDKMEFNSINDFITKRKLGINLLTATENDIYPIVEKWQNSRKMLGPLLLNQEDIAGIGVAWGSEILNNADLLPNVSAKLQDLTNLTDSIIYTRDKILETYKKYVKNNNPVEVVNNWFRNLYKVREMNVYKTGKSIKVYGRDWWINY